MITSIEKSFLTNEPIDKAWDFLKDLNLAIPCLPGASITEQLDENKFRGKVILRFGPVHTHYLGEVIVEKLDAGNHEVLLIGKGLDSKGHGTANVTMNGQLIPAEEGSTEVNLNMKVEITGKLALLGPGLIADVINEVLNQFVARFKDELAGSPLTQDSAKAGENSLDGFTLIEAAVKGFLGRLFKRGK